VYRKTWSFQGPELCSEVLVSCPDPGSYGYKGNNWEAFFTYIDLDYGTASGDTDSWKVGGKYMANGWSVAAVYEDLAVSAALL